MTLNFYTKSVFVSFSHKIIISYRVYRYVSEQTPFGSVHFSFRTLSVIPVNLKGKYSLNFSQPPSCYSVLQNEFCLTYFT
jgi:hypothetical protein